MSRVLFRAQNYKDAVRQTFHFRKNMFQIGKNRPFQRNFPILSPHFLVVVVPVKVIGLTTTGIAAYYLRKLQQLRQLEEFDAVGTLNQDVLVLGLLLGNGGLDLFYVVENREVRGEG